MPQANPKKSSAQEQQQTAQTASNAAPYQQQFEDDTINLYELWIVLWKRKWLIIAVTVLAALGSVAYAMQLQRVYKAEALLLPPKSKDIPSLNIPGIVIPTTIEENTTEYLSRFSVENVFSMFKQNLNSRNLNKKFIQKYGLMEIIAPNRTLETRDEDIYKGFTEMIKLEEKNGLTSLSIELHDAEIAAQWVNDIIEFFDKETVAMMLDNLQNSIENHIKAIEYKIESKRQMVRKRKEDQIDELKRSIYSKRIMASSRRNDKIKRYEEAAIIAKALGIESGFTQQTKLIDPSSGTGAISPSTARESFLGTSPIAQMNVGIATATTPLFYLGIDALEAELKVLKEREDDDPFIPGLRELQEQLTLLNSIKSEDPFIENLRESQEQLILLDSIKFDKEKMTSVHIDQSAYPAKSPIKPNRRLIVSFTTMVGLFSGIFLAFFIEFVQNQRKKYSE